MFATSKALFQHMTRRHYMKHFQDPLQHSAMCLLQLAFWLLLLSEMNQANFVGESINEPETQYAGQKSTRHSAWM
jgi:hypothetical protein